MLKSPKIQKAIFVILLIAVVSELIYLFYYKTPISQTISQNIPLPTPIPSISVKSSTKTNYTVGISSIIKVESGQKLKNIITEAKTKGQEFTSDLSILNGLSQAENCTFDLETKKCFQLHNQEEKTWKTISDSDLPISISGPFIVKLNFNGTKGVAGIDLNGRPGGKNGNWWENLDQIFFGIGDDGKHFYIDAKNNGKDPFVLYDKIFDKKIDGVYVLFNETGTSFLVTDLSFNEITFIDLNKVTNNKFPEGLFPDKQFYIGYTIAPLSDLVVYDFSIL